MPDTVLCSATRLKAESEVARAVNWDHPDVAGEELPSQSRALRALAQLLSNEVDRLDLDHSNDNSHWQAWAKSPAYHDQKSA